MKGATADPLTRMISPPKMNSTRNIGTSQYFLRAIRKRQSSAKKDIRVPMGAGGSELVGHATGLRPGRIAYDPVAWQIGATVQRQHVLTEQPHDHADRRHAEEEHRADDDGTDDTMQQQAETEPNVVQREEHARRRETQQGKNNRHR